MCCGRGLRSTRSWVRCCPAARRSRRMRRWYSIRSGWLVRILRRGGWFVSGWGLGDIPFGLIHRQPQDDRKLPVRPELVEGLPSTSSGRSARATRSIVFSVFSVPQCPLCQRKPHEYACMASTGACSDAASDTEDTEAQRAQRNFVISRSTNPTPHLVELCSTCDYGGCIKMNARILSTPSQMPERRRVVPCAASTGSARPFDKLRAIGFWASTGSARPFDKLRAIGFWASTGSARPFDKFRAIGFWASTGSAQTGWVGSAPLAAKSPHAHHPVRLRLAERAPSHFAHALFHLS